MRLDHRPDDGQAKAGAAIAVGGQRGIGMLVADGSEDLSGDAWPLVGDRQLKAARRIGGDLHLNGPPRAMHQRVLRQVPDRQGQEEAVANELVVCRYHLPVVFAKNFGPLAAVFLLMPQP